MSTAFARAIDSQFERFGQDAAYIHVDSRRQTIRVIARLPEQVFEVGEQSLHGEKAELSLRVVDVSLPVIGDEMHIGKSIYTITEYIRKDLHQLVWIVLVRIKL